MGQIDYDKIAKRVEKRLNKRREFYTHLVSFISVNLFLWGIWVVTTPGGFPWPAFVTFGWGIGMVIHAADYFASMSADERRENEIDKEIQREKMRLYGDPYYREDADSDFEKPKRKSKNSISTQEVRLSDDGELIVDEDPQTFVPNRSNRSR